jgi:hypothetical protein
MSILTMVKLSCPTCGTANDFESVQSVNADRRPDMREAILKGEFQRQPCVACGKVFRLDTGFVYVDLGRKLWISARPVTGFDAWQQHEADARALFERAYGSGAPRAVRELADGVRPRLVFGWPALREKLIVAEAGLDDTVLELLKMAMLRNLDEIPFAADTTLRLVDLAPPDKLVTAWVANPDDATTGMKAVPRKLYDDIVADLGRAEASRWAPVRAEFDGALFVDVDRLMLRATAA